MEEMDFLETIKAFQKSVIAINELQNRLQQNAELRDNFMRRYNITNFETIQNMNNIHSMIGTPYKTFEQNIKLIDTLTSFRKNAHIIKTFSFAPFLNNLNNNLSKDFLELVDKYNGSHQGEVLIEDIKEEDIEIKRPGLFNIALKINIVINVTEAEIAKSEVSDEDKKNWNNFFKPLLSALYSLFLTWSLSTTPISHTNIYKSVEGVISYVESFIIDDELDNIEQEFQTLDNKAPFIASHKFEE